MGTWGPRNTGLEAMDPRISGSQDLREGPGNVGAVGASVHHCGFISKISWSVFAVFAL